MGNYKGFRAELFTSEHHAPNGGLSATRHQVTIVTDDNAAQWCTDTDEAPAVEVVRRGNHVFLRPVAPVPAGHVGYMASGTLVHDGGSGAWERVIGHAHPVELHDRTEDSGLSRVLSL